MYGYINPEVTETAGGAERQLNIVTKLLSDRFDVHVIVGDYGQDAREVHDRVTFHKAYRQDPSASPLSMPLEFFKLARAMWRVDADVYIYRGHPQKASFISILAQLLQKEFIYNLANDPNITDQRSELPVGLRQLFDATIRNAATVIVQTQKQQRLLRERLGVEGDIVPNGYSTVDDQLDYEKREGVLWVGRIDREKRPDVFLNVASRLQNGEFCLIGPPGRDEEYHEEIVKRARTLDNVSYLGYVNPKEIHSYYRRAGVLVNTSEYEGFPNTFLEAWRYGTPVASLDVNPGRYLEAEVDGFADGDVGALTSIVDEFMTNPDRRRAIGTKSRVAFESAYSIDTVAKLYGDAIEQSLH